MAARLTLEHTSSLLRSLGFASHPLGWFAFFTLASIFSTDREALVSRLVEVYHQAALSIRTEQHTTDMSELQLAHACDSLVVSRLLSSLRKPRWACQASMVYTSWTKGYDLHLSISAGSITVAYGLDEKRVLD